MTDAAFRKPELLSAALLAISTQLNRFETYWTEPIDWIDSLYEGGEYLEDPASIQYSHVWESIELAIARVRDALQLVSDHSLRERLRQLHGDLLIVLEAMDAAASRPGEMLDCPAECFGEKYSTVLDRCQTNLSYLNGLADELFDREQGRDLKPESWGIYDAASTVNADTDEMPDRVKRAGASLEYLKEKHAALFTINSGSSRVTRKQYDALRANGCDAYWNEATEEHELPAYDTWARYAREYLRLTEGPRNQSRAGRSGRSIVSQDDL